MLTGVCSQPLAAIAAAPGAAAWTTATYIGLWLGAEERLAAGARSQRRSRAAIHGGAVGRMPC